MPDPIQYPTITVGGTAYQLRFSHGAWHQLQRWGYALGDPKLPIYALAAASAGVVDKKGNWHTVEFARVLDFCDALGADGDSSIAEISQAVLDALGKVAPKADLTLVQPSAESSEQKPN